MTRRQVYVYGRNTPVGLVKYYTQQDIAKQCDVTRQTIVRWWQKGKLPEPDALVGQNHAWLASSIDAWIAAGGDKT